MVSYAKDNSAGTLDIVVESTNETSTKKHQSTVQPNCADVLAVGDKIKAVDAFYRCPILTMAPDSPETEYTQDQLLALTIFLKADTKDDAELFPM